MRLLAVSGSLQRASKNRELLRVAATAPPAGVEVHVFEGIGLLPHFDPDIEARGEVPAGVLAWRRELAASDAVLIASPEYGHSLPGVLKNAIDWLIGSGELEGKVIAITAAVPAPERGRRGLQALAQTLGAVSAVIVGGEPIARGPGFELAVRQLVEHLVETTREVAKQRADAG
jgi:NAD(P)H-dependent FMN reductase